MGAKMDVGSGFMDIVDRVLLHNLPSINLFRLRQYGNCKYEDDPFNMVDGMLAKIPNVEKLRQVWSVVPDLLGHIPSLKVLLLTKASSFCGYHMPFSQRKMMERIERNTYPRSNNDTKCREVCLWCGAPENVPKCLSLSVEPIEFNGFSGCKKVIKLERYLLENAMVLKKLAPHSWSSVVIKAPSLETLELNDAVSSVFEVDELPALVKAKFRVWLHGDDYECSDYYCNAVVRMIAKASNVRHLRLHNLTLKVVIHASAYNQLLFRSLTHLDIGIHDIPWSVVPDLLGHIPSLTVLVLNKFLLLDLIKGLCNGIAS
ncbi:hypothetical protein RHSIM_Rhsim04G0071200 [Rhododendron simsii]|uniref:FBD domain-containing protein n=1 Tax=Rhododendron simsii TaxID=118357 RepID=A0A834LP00_RHOSS|nr:hypothetical protein RHSIM_Rhsim04G0071200 [Rhododendron simsii]